MDNTLEAALLDVRHAYRLIEDFQQRLISALDFMREELNLEYYYQCTRQSVPRSLNGLEGQQNAGRRFLPLNDMSVFWLKHSGQNEPHNYPQEGDFMLDVWLRSDSGNGHNGYPSSPAETSESLLYIHVICCKTPDAGRQNWYDLWCNMDYADNGDVQPVKGHEGFVMCLEKINMVSLKDQKTFSACLDAFKQGVSQKLGINFS